MKTLRLAVVATGMLLQLADPSSAGHYVGTVKRLEQYIDGRVYVGLNISESRPAACQHHPDFQVVFSTNEPGGRGMLAQLLTAQATGREVAIGGQESCNRAADYEDVYFVQVR